MFKVFGGFKFQIFAGNEFEERGKMMTIELSFGFPIDTWVEHPQLSSSSPSRLVNLTSSTTLLDSWSPTRRQPRLLNAFVMSSGSPAPGPGGEAGYDWRSEENHRFTIILLIIIIFNPVVQLFGVLLDHLFKVDQILKCFLCSKWRGIFLPALQKVLQQVQHSSLFQKGCDPNLWKLSNCQFSNCDPNLWKLHRCTQTWWLGKTL